MNVPKELNACVSVRRLEAVACGPRIATYGFAATCSSVMPDARTKRAPRNIGYERLAAAGKKITQPAAAINRPMTMPGLYPTFSTRMPEGTHLTKYAPEKP